jgi:uncharacterized protein YlxW (UPF0749 family)
MTSRPETTSGSGEAELPRQPDAPRPGGSAPAAPPPPEPAPTGEAPVPDADLDAPPPAAEPADEPADGVENEIHDETLDEVPAQTPDETPDESPEQSLDETPDAVRDPVPDDVSGDAPGDASGDVSGADSDAVPDPEEPPEAALAEGRGEALDAGGDPAATAAPSEADTPAPGPQAELPPHGADADEAEHVVATRAPEFLPTPATVATDVPDADVPASLLPGNPQDAGPPARAVARGRLGHAMRPRATRGQVLAGLLCALLGFALVVQARQTQTQGLEQLRQADLVRLLDNVTNAEARAEQDVRDQQAIRDRLLSGSDSSEAAQQAAQQRLDTLGLLAGTVPASGPGIQLEISDPRRQVDASVLLDTLEELRDGGAEVVQIGDVRVVAATAFTDDAEGVRVDNRLLTPPYRYTVIGEPQTLAKVLQIPGGVLDVLRSKGAQGRVSQPPTVRVDALRAPTQPQYARPAPGGTP